MLEDGEACDGDDLGGQSCFDLGYPGGLLRCAPECTLDVSLCEKPPLCGDGVWDSGEECDGSDLGGRTCLEDAGHADGTLFCTPGCLLDTAACHTCGDGVAEADEECDGVVVGVDCATLTGHGEGNVTCDAGCRLDTAQCHSCGDSVVEGLEVCDDQDLQGATCLTEVGHTGGTLRCAADCTGFDTQSCHTCGDGVAQADELCDIGDLRGESCASLAGHVDGVPVCLGDCSGFDVSICHSCGNGIQEVDEACDATDFVGQSCVAAGYDGGPLVCMSACTVDYTACWDCGDGKLDPSEVCDGALFGSDTCLSLTGHVSGTISCAVDCQSVDVSACHTCGDDLAQGPELCDGPDFGGGTCAGLTGHVDGQVTCLSDCLGWETSGCHTLGDGVVGLGEECDDGNLIDGDGCSCTGVVEPYCSCVGSPSVCSGACAFVDNDPAITVRDGTSWPTAFVDVQEGIDLAASLGPHCEVWVAEGLYRQYKSHRQNSLLLADSIDVYGGFAGGETQRDPRDPQVHLTVLEGRNAAETVSVYHVVRALNVSSLLDGFQITGGVADANGMDSYGGGVLSLAADLRLQNCHITLNQAWGGAGLYAENGTLTADHCLFEDNDAEHSGGGMFTESPINVVVSNSRFTLNDADVGGGVRLRGTPTFSNCLFWANRAFGGSTNDGGGLANESQLTLINSTFANNHAQAWGSGIYNWGLITMINTIVWGNTTTGIVDGGGGYTSATYSNTQIFRNGVGNLNQDPHFVGASNYRLQSSSPCIDTATDADAPALDLNGQPRVDIPAVGTPGTQADMGAFEYQ